MKTRKTSPLAARALLPLALLVAAAGYGAFRYFQPRGPSEIEARQASLPSDEVLTRFSFTMTPQQVGELFGVAPAPRVEVELRDAGVFKKATVSIAPGSSPSYSAHWLGGARFDGESVRERLAELAPNRLKSSAHNFEINTAKSLLRLDPRVLGAQRGSIQIMSWRDDERAPDVADALLAVARYATLEGPRPSEAQLAIVNGPKLPAVGRLDASAPIDEAKQAVTEAFPFAACNLVTDLMTKRTQLQCKAEVDDALVDHVVLAWPNDAAAQIETITLALDRTKSALYGTLVERLDGALGPNERVVTDHASGAGHHAWKLDESGATLTMDAARLLVTVPAAAHAADPPAWRQALTRALDAVASAS